MLDEKSPGAAIEAGRADMNNVNITQRAENVKVPLYVSVLEAGLLYRFMVLLEYPNQDFLDSRNKVIFDVLENIYQQGGRSFLGVTCLLKYLSEFGLLKDAGGVEYVRTIFGNYEPEAV